jgi:hypothetical protein
MLQPYGIGPARPPVVSLETGGIETCYLQKQTALANRSTVYGKMKLFLATNEDTVAP